MSFSKKRVAGLIGVVGLATLAPFLSRHTTSRSHETVETVASVENVSPGPTYSEGRVPANYCSRYVRLAAEDLFNITYPSTDAWDMRAEPGMRTTPARGANDLSTLADQGILTPGDILGAYNPTSRYNRHPVAQKVGYTHVLLYLGREGNEFFFADKFGPETRTRISLRELQKKGLKPVEIIDKDPNR